MVFGMRLLWTISSMTSEKNNIVIFDGVYYDRPKYGKRAYLDSP